ncbi:MAG: hypothetical protein ACJ74I_16670 [Gaiellaceae bacterium]
MQHGGEAVAAAAAHHHHDDSCGASLMAGWHQDSTKTSTPRRRHLRELLAGWWRRIRGS